MVRDLTVIRLSRWYRLQSSDPVLQRLLSGEVGCSQVRREGERAWVVTRLV